MPSPFSVHTFVSKIKQDGLANTSRYTVSIVRQVLSSTSPTGQQESADMNSKANRMVINCENIDLPGISITTFERKYYQVVRRLPYSILYGSVNASFYLDDNYTERKFFEEWLGQIINMTTYDVSFYDDIISTINITAYNINGIPNMSINLYEAYPIQISNVNLAYANETMANKLAIELTYKNYEIIDPSGLFNTELPEPIIS